MLIKTQLASIAEPLSNICTLQKGMPESKLIHTSVLLEEVLELLQPQPGETVLDVTMGLGGHAKALLDVIGPKGNLVGLDADAMNLTRSKEHLSSYEKQITLLHVNFGELPELQLEPVDILLADLGLSSPHLDAPERGFSFRGDGPLDMRFDQDKGKPASKLLADLSEAEICELFWKFGELKPARKIANAIKESLPTTTAQMREMAERVLGFRAKTFLPQIFQALRIAVNDELGSLRVLLTEGPKLLTPGGRMGVISFHSLEDRMVKQTFREFSTPAKDPETGKIAKEASFRLLTKKPIRPGEAEIQENPRSRSALLRGLQKVSD